MKKALLFAILCIAFQFAAIAQSSNPWKFVQKETMNSLAERSVIPEQYKTARLGIMSLKKTLNAAPKESFSGKKSDVTLSLPMPDGSFEAFYISESSLMDPKLADQFPEIKSYVGTSVQHPATYARFDFTPQGFHAIVLGAEGNTVYIEPFAKGSQEQYISYYNRDVPVEVSQMSQFTTDEIQQQVAGVEMTPPCGIIRTYSLVVAATGEFTAFSGGTVASAMSAINTLVTYANGIFEKELHVRLILVAGNASVVFTNGNTDPYTLSTLLDDQNQSTCDAIIGVGGYDLGFLVHKMTDGQLKGAVTLNKVCTTDGQAKSFVGTSDPLSAFYRQIMVSNLGDQFGAALTHNGTDCGSGFNGQSVETGAGSTIMSVAGICDPAYQTYVDNYFSGANLTVLNARVMGHTCADDMSTINVAPTVSAGPDRVFPVSTKFILNAAGADEGNAMTYCWEQMDPETGIMPPTSTATSGPVFRSFPPTSSPDRRFPRPNVSNTWEKIPSVSRTMHFKVTARDNSPYGGCTADDDVTITTSSAAGPFVVTYPNGGPVSNANQTICPNSTITVTWQVAGTNASPVNCANVDILLSTSSGNAYLILLASNTPNDGSEDINLSLFSNINSPNCRIMVRSHWSDGSTNVFFDESDNDFVISYTPVAFLNGSPTPATGLSYVCVGVKNVFKVLSPCKFPITAFPTSGQFPDYVSTDWDPVNQVFSFTFAHQGGFAVTFRVTTPFGNYDLVCVVIGRVCEGGFASPNDPGDDKDYAAFMTEERVDPKNPEQVDYSAELIRLFPNPASVTDRMTLEIPNTQGINYIAIYDMKGALVQKTETSENSMSLDLSRFIPGAYFVKVTSTYFSATRKFIIGK